MTLVLTAVSGTMTTMYNILVHTLRVTKRLFWFWLS